MENMRERMIYIKILDINHTLNITKENKIKLELN